MKRWLLAAHQPVDAASLGVFRIAVGILVLAETSRYFLHGWINALYVEPDFLFKYLGFGWVVPWPGTLLYWHFGLMGVLALLVTIGVAYRFAVVGLFLTFGYVFLLDQANYLNQYYLALSVLLILCIVPADRGYSLRAGLGGRPAQATVPTWSVWALRLQFELVLVYAGIVKLNGDWLQGLPLELWFSLRAEDAPLMASLLQAPGISVAAAYAVVALHIVGAPLLLWERTRFAVFLLYVAFHLTNSILFNIGVFPWLTLVGTLMFFEPGWPRQVAARLSDTADSSPSPVRRPPFCVRWFPLVVLTLFFASQLLLPLRHVVYPGNVAWTSEGYTFAWRMKLDDRRATARFEILDPDSGRRWFVDPADYLTERQVAQMSFTPDMVIQFAHYIGVLWASREGVKNAEVRAHVLYSLNGRPLAPLIDSRQDLTLVSRSLDHHPWILPAPDEF